MILAGLWSDPAPGAGAGSGSYYGWDRRYLQAWKTAKPYQRNFDGAGAGAGAGAAAAAGAAGATAAAVAGIATATAAVGTVAVAGAAAAADVDALTDPAAPFVAVAAATRQTRKKKGHLSAQSPT